jgi:hypothetical protein
MTDISLTAAQIAILPGAVTRRRTAGATITIGQVVYIASDGDAEPADGNVSAAAARGIGIAVESYDGETTVNAGDPVTVCVFGPVSGFSGATPGSYGYLSDTVGRIGDSAGTFAFILGYFESAGVFFVNPGIDDPTS